jgi:hypothetical protein
MKKIVSQLPPVETWDKVDFSSHFWYRDGNFIRALELELLTNSRVQSQIMLTFRTKSPGKK